MMFGRPMVSLSFNALYYHGLANNLLHNGLYVNTKVKIVRFETRLALL